jgi:hypothetical protein
MSVAVNSKSDSHGMRAKSLSQLRRTWILPDVWLKAKCTRSASEDRDSPAARRAAKHKTSVPLAVGKATLCFVRDLLARRAATKDSQCESAGLRLRSTRDPSSGLCLQWSYGTAGSAARKSCCAMEPRHAANARLATEGEPGLFSFIKIVTVHFLDFV